MVTMPIILNPMPQLISVASEGDHYDQMTLEKVLFFFFPGLQMILRTKVGS